MRSASELRAYALEEAYVLHAKRLIEVLLTAESGAVLEPSDRQIEAFKIGVHKLDNVFARLSAKLRESP